MSINSQTLSQNNEQILDDIQTLQQMEQQLFNNLETNTTLTPEQKQKIVDKMNQLSTMRINLYQTLSGVNNVFHNALSSSVGTLQEQTTAINIVELELNQAKKRLEMLEAERNNKIRLVEINDYYGDRYAEHSQMMKIVIFVLVPVILLAFLNKKGFLPDKIYYVLVVIIAFIGGIFLWRRYASIIMRDNMNYQEYAWPFDPNSVSTTTSSSTSSDPWATTTIPGTCVGQRCCSDGLTWDANINQCIAAVTGTTTTTGTTTATGTTTTTGTTRTGTTTTTESFVNNALTKKQPGKYKYDYNMAPEIQAPLSKSFINSNK